MDVPEEPPTGNSTSPKPRIRRFTHRAQELVLRRWPDSSRLRPNGLAETQRIHHTLTHPSITTVFGISRQVIAAGLICVCVYQWGACPCGCLEHNLWANLIGLTTADEHNEHDHAPLGDTAVLTALSDHHHHCSGQPSAKYVDNARRVTRCRDQAIDRHADVFAWSPSVLTLTTTRHPAFRQTNADAVVAYAPTRSMLQIFRL